MEWDKVVHVLLVSFPAQGHVIPLLRLGKCLAESGMLVTFSTAAAYGHAMTKASKLDITREITPFGDGFLRFKFFDDGWEDFEPKRYNPQAYLPQLESSGRESIKQMIKEFAKEKTPVACIINNQFFPWAVDVAAELGIPSVVLWCYSCAVFTVFYHCYHDLLTLSLDMSTDTIFRVPSLPDLKNNDMPEFFSTHCPYPIFKDTMLAQFKNLTYPFCILMDTFEELESENIQYMSKLFPIKSIGPLFKSIKLQNNVIKGDMLKADDCIDWLNSKPNLSVVYISFGTVVHISQKQVEEIAHALMDWEVSFLWVLKPPHKEWSSLLKEFTEKTVERGKVVQFSPQEEVLAHPTVACFVTHCGWNSSMETLASGVPVVTFPLLGDQFTNSKFLVDEFGVGILMGHGQVEGNLADKNEIKRCLREATVGSKSEEMKEQALKWKRAAADAVAESGSSFHNLQWCVDEIKRRRQRGGQLAPEVLGSSLAAAVWEGLAPMWAGLPCRRRSVGRFPRVG